MNMIKTLAVMSLSAMSFAASATTMVSGIQTNVSEASFLSSGWIEASAVSTAAQTNQEIAFALAGIGQNNLIAVGVRDNSTGLFVAVAETTLASFQTYTGYNQTHDDNGVSWYYNGYSLGFTALGNAINQNQADINLYYRNNMGLSWHTNANGNFDASMSPDSFYGGWAANNGSFISTWSDDYSRVFLDGGPLSNNVPEPTSLALLAAGLLGFGASRRKKNKA